MNNRSRGRNTGRYGRSSDGVRGNRASCSGCHDANPAGSSGACLDSHGADRGCCSASPAGCYGRCDSPGDRRADRCGRSGGHRADRSDCWCGHRGVHNGCRDAPRGVRCDRFGGLNRRPDGRSGDPAARRAVDRAGARLSAALRAVPARSGWPGDATGSCRGYGTELAGCRRATSFRAKAPGRVPSRWNGCGNPDGPCRGCGFRFGQCGQPLPRFQALPCP